MIGIDDGHSSRLGSEPSEPAAVPAAPAVAYRDQAPGDDAVVRRAHADRHRAPLVALGWPDAAIEQFCDRQHAMFERHLTLHHPAAERRMIVAGGRTVGRVCLDRHATSWRIVDLVLVADARGGGIGGAVLRGLIDEATAAGVALDLHVGRDNPRAAALYLRLGFVEADADATRRRLVRSVAAAIAPPPA